MHLHASLSLCAPLSQGTRERYRTIIELTSAGMPDPLQKAWGDIPTQEEIFDPSTLCDPSWRESGGFPYFNPP